MDNKKTNKKTLWKRFVILPVIMLLMLVSASAQTPYEVQSDETICMHVFLDYECGECDQAKAYLESLNTTGVNIIYHNINNESEKEIYETFKETYGLQVAGYPSVFIGDSYFTGLDSIKDNVQDTIENCKEEGCPCPATKIKGFSPSIPKGDYKPEQTEVLTIPLVGKVDVGRMPLFLMTGLIAFVDGFNPCSLWVLTFLLGIVVYTASRKRMLIIGLTFLLVTAAAYGGFILGLLNVFTYIGYLMWIKIVVALVALLFAAVNIKDYFWYKKGISFTISDKYKPTLFKRVRNIMSPTQSTGGMILLTIVMALGIVLVELPCTSGFPMIWSGIIAQNNVQGSQFIALFSLYIFIYLLLELIVFGTAVITLKTSHFNEKHGRILKLIGGMIMLSLAISMVFFPDAMTSISGSIYVFGIAGLVSYLVILLHRKILPRFGIYIGTEKLQSENERAGKDNSKTEEKKGDTK